jgi:hypothetical protein
LTCGLPAFINLTRPLILNGAGSLLPRELAVLEIREDVPIDPEVIDACQRLHAEGYSLALDDFTPGSEAETLLPWVRYVKIDVLATPAPQWRDLAARFGQMKIHRWPKKSKRLKSRNGPAPPDSSSSRATTTAGRRRSRRPRCRRGGWPDRAQPRESQPRRSGRSRQA